LGYICEYQDYFLGHCQSFLNAKLTVCGENYDLKISLKAKCWGWPAVNMFSSRAVSECFASDTRLRYAMMNDRTLKQCCDTRDEYGK
jgi:hypothetical protein